MKKKTVVMLLAISLTLSGCGNAKATNVDVPQQAQVQEQGQEIKQEQPQEQEVNQDAEQEQKEENNDTADVEIGKEYSNNDIVIKVEDTEQEYFLDDKQYQNTQGNITTTDEVPIYCEEGYKIGHINSGVTLEITEHAVDSAWYRFENPISDTPYDYIYVSQFDTDMSNIEVLAGTIKQGDYNFEVKDEYTSDEAQNVFFEVLNHYGMLSDYTKFDIDDGIHIYIPVKNTVEWAEEKKDFFLENGVTYFNLEGYGEIAGVGASAKLQIKNDEKVFTEEELKQFFSSDIDLELQKQAEGN